VEVEVEGQTEREPLVSRRAEVAVADRGGAARQAAIDGELEAREPAGEAWRSAVHGSACLAGEPGVGVADPEREARLGAAEETVADRVAAERQDRKRTRLNSGHVK